MAEPLATDSSDDLVILGHYKEGDSECAFEIAWYRTVEDVPLGVCLDHTKDRLVLAAVRNLTVDPQQVIRFEKSYDGFETFVRYEGKLSGEPGREPVTASGAWVIEGGQGSWHSEHIVSPMPTGFATSLWLSGDIEAAAVADGDLEYRRLWFRESLLGHGIYPERDMLFFGGSGRDCAEALARLLEPVEPANRPTIEDLAWASKHMRHEGMDVWSAIARAFQRPIIELQLGWSDSGPNILFAKNMHDMRWVLDSPAHPVVVIRTAEAGDLLRPQFPLRVDLDESEIPRAHSYSHGIYADRVIRMIESMARGARKRHKIDTLTAQLHRLIHSNIEETVDSHPLLPGLAAMHKQDGLRVEPTGHMEVDRFSASLGGRQRFEIFWVQDKERLTAFAAESLFTNACLAPESDDNEPCPFIAVSPHVVELKIERTGQSQVPFRQYWSPDIFQDFALPDTFQDDSYELRLRQAWMEFIHAVADDADAIDNYDWLTVERAIGQLLRKLGFHVESASLGPDGGFDHVVTGGPLDEFVARIQVKHRRSRKVHGSEIEHYGNLAASDMTDVVILLSSSGYTRPRRALTMPLPYVCADRGHLHRLARTWRLSRSGFYGPALPSDPCHEWKVLRRILRARGSGSDRG